MVARQTIKAWDPTVYWTNESVAQTITDKAVEFIDKNSGPDKDPFFLYYAHNIPHGPVTPAKKYQGTSECGPYGDFVQELDAQVGEVLAAVDEARKYRDTLVIFTSDNEGGRKPSS
jgi:arylsulfatase A